VQGLPQRLRIWAKRGVRKAHLQRVAALLELLARFLLDLAAELHAAALSQRHGLAQDVGLHRDELDAGRRLVESDDSGQVLQSELIGVNSSDLVDQLALVLSAGRPLVGAFSALVWRCPAR